MGQRLIVLNTYEYSGAATANYPQRARWCAKQNPANWDDTVAGGGGYTDAATGDQIISARQLQNQIIVFFTSSVWSLTPTTDPNRAFIWKRINNFRACDGKMASIGYDRYVVALGVRGITATDGVETRRIDNRIVDFTSSGINIEEFEKVFCERSYNNNRWWTLFNNNDSVSNENDKALIYDDDSSSYSTYSIDMNCLGYGNLTQDYGLDDFTVANNLDIALEDGGKTTLLSYFWIDTQEILLGGDIYGNVYLMEIGGDDHGTDISSEFTTTSWNPFKEEGKESQLNYVDFYVDTDVSTTAEISLYKDTDVAPYKTQTIDFLPNLKVIGQIISSDQTNPVNVNIANHGLSTGDIIYIYGVQGMIEINSGESATSYTITYVDADNITLDGIDGTAFTAFTSGGVAYRNGFYKTKVWKRVFASGIGFQHRISFSSTGSDRPFRIHAIQPAFKKRGKREVN